MQESLYTSLIDVALVASRHGLVDASDRIFAGLIKTKPGDDRALMAKAISRIYINRAPEAISLLEDGILKEDPNHPFARGFLGFAHKMAGNKEQGNRILREVIAENEHATAVDFATSLLEDPAFDNIGGQELQPADEGSMHDTYTYHSLIYG